jgi:Tol biopolymer transport system component
MRSILVVAVLLACGAGAATLAYVDSNGHLVYQAQGVRPRVVDTHGYEPSLRRDGKQLVYTRTGGDARPNTLVLYDAATDLSRDLITGYVSQPQWSPDGSRIVFLRYDVARLVWVMDPSEPAKAQRLSDRDFKALASWTPQGDAVLAYDYDKLYWIGLDGKILRVLPGEALYGKELEWMSSNQIRIHPANSGLLAVSAYFQESPNGAPRDEMGLTPTIMLFDAASGKRTPVLPKSNWGMDAHWSPDGSWLYFSRGEGRNRSGIWRIHPDGSGLERVIAGTQPDVAR